MSIELLDENQTIFKPCFYLKESKGIIPDTKVFLRFFCSNCLWERLNQSE